LLEEGFDVVYESYARELACGEVDADADFLHPGAIALPLLELPAGLSEPPVSDGENEAVFLGLRDEFHGRDEATEGVLPANECFKADDAAGNEVDFGLVVEDELFLVKSGAEVFRAGPCDGGEGGVGGRGVGLGDSAAGGVEGGSGPKSTEFQLVGDESGEAGEDAKVFGAHVTPRLVAADREDADDVSIA
jgi:hypothetical protein